MHIEDPPKRHQVIDPEQAAATGDTLEIVNAPKRCPRNRYAQEPCLTRDVADKRNTARFVWAYCQVITVRSTRAAHRGKITSNYWNRDPVPAGWVVASATAAKYDMFPAPQADRHGTGKLRRESVAARSSATYPADGVAVGIATNIADGKSCFTIYRSLMRGVCVSYRRSACAPGSAARRQARARRACTRWTGRGVH